MILYYNVCYWLSDFHRGGRIVGKDETFNQCHVRLRNVVERAFDVVKSRFLIFKRMIRYSFTTKTKVVVTCFAIHNFSQQVLVINRLFFQYDKEMELGSDNTN